MRIKLNQKKLFVWLGLVLGLNSQAQFDIQGHRGCRGIFPENGIEGMIHAIELGVVTLEMDVVVSKDGVVLLSHEPWISAELCDSAEVTIEDDPSNYSIFQMTFEEVQSFDCGRKPLSRFPDQQKIKTHKPSLRAVLEAIEKYCTKKEIPLPRLNIETKSSLAGDDLFHPKPGVFVDAIAQVINTSPFKDRMMLQSFDPRTLEYAKVNYPKWRIALLVEGDLPPKKGLKLLSFVPDVYSPNFDALTLDRVAKLHEMGIKVVPWTVNDLEKARQLFGWGVDGLITDYPNLIHVEALRAE